MESHIVINSRIYEKYKEDILPLSARLFCDDYFYNLSSYEVPLDLKGIATYLPYIKKITLYTTATFIDFVNVLLVLSFLNDNNYQNEVQINYYLLNGDSLNKALFVSSKLTHYEDANVILESIKNNKKISSVNLKIPGFINYVNFFNMFVDTEDFLIYFEELIDECEEDNEKIAEYLADKYSNMGINKQYYLDYLNKIM